MENYPPMTKQERLLCILPLFGTSSTQWSFKLVLIWCCKIWEVLRNLFLQSKSGLVIWPWKGFRAASALGAAEPGHLPEAWVEKTCWASCTTIAQEHDLMFWRQMCQACLVAVITFDCWNQECLPGVCSGHVPAPSREWDLGVCCQSPFRCDGEMGAMLPHWACWTEAPRYVPQARFRVSVPLNPFLPLLLLFSQQHVQLWHPLCHSHVSLGENPRHNRCFANVVATVCLAVVKKGVELGFISGCEGAGRGLRPGGEEVTVTRGKQLSRGEWEHTHCEGWPKEGKSWGTEYEPSQQMRRCANRFRHRLASWKCDAQGSMREQEALCFVLILSFILIMSFLTCIF